MVRRHALIRSAWIGSVTLGISAVTTTLTEFGTDRLHLLLIAGTFLAALLAAILLVTALLEAALQRQVDAVTCELNNAVAQAADELHTAVAEMGEVTRLDRTILATARALMAELTSARKSSGCSEPGHDRAA